MAITKFTDTNFSPQFKRIYGEYTDNLYGSGAEDPLFAAIHKDYTKLRGSNLEFPVKLGFGGSVGFGSLPTANTAKYRTVSLTRQKAYARLNLDRETIHASKGKDAAFKEATQAEVDAKLKSFMRIMACALYNDGTGIRGQFSATPGGTAAAPTVVILNTGTYAWRPAFFEEGDQVNVYSAAAVAILPSVWEITAINTSTRTLTLSRISGSDDLTAIAAGTHSIVLANSYNAEPMGLKGCVEFSTGNFEGVAYERRWSSYRVNAQVNSVNTPISPDHFNDVAINVETNAGESPDLYICSPKQYQRLLNRLGDAKKFCDVLSSSSSGSKVRMAFKAIELETANGSCKVVSSRYVQSDKVYAANTDKDKMCQYYLGKPEWFEDDGKMLLRDANSDFYEARYGTYMQNFFNPQYHADIYNLAS